MCLGAFYYKAEGRWLLRLVIVQEKKPSEPGQVDEVYISKA